MALTALAIVARSPGQVDDFARAARVPACTVNSRWVARWRGVFTLRAGALRHPWVMTGARKSQMTPMSPTGPAPRSFSATARLAPLLAFLAAPFGPRPRGKAREEMRRLLTEKGMH